jgi:hypothetical protein
MTAYDYAVLSAVDCVSAETAIVRNRACHPIRISNVRRLYTV